MAFSQNWLLTGNTGNANSNFLGTTDARALVFKTNNIERGRLQNTGSWRLGSGGNNITIDSTGKLVFNGSGFYQLGQNAYVFRLADKPNYGMFFNSNAARYELRDSLAAPMFALSADSGNAIFQGRIEPALNNTVSLGTASSGWKDLFINGSIFNGSIKTFAADNNKGNYFIGQEAGNLNTGTNNIAIGRQALLSNTAGLSNTAIGTSVLTNNLTGSGNIGAGENTLLANTTGNDNAGIGSNALSGNTTGSSNVAVGRASLFSNTTGASNIAIGLKALTSNRTGNKLVAVGDSALFNQNGGEGFNTAVGSKAMFTNSSGSSNTANGYQSLFSNTTGSNNTAIGTNALGKNATGSNNVAIGKDAMSKVSGMRRSIAIGVAALSKSSGFNTIGIGDSALFNFGGTGFSEDFNDANTAIGTKALFSLVTGNRNTAVGDRALFANTSTGNTAVGNEALLSNTNGFQNVAVGVGALLLNTSGFNNTALGVIALRANTTGDNGVAVGQLSLSKNTTGDGNTGVGEATLFENISGSANVAVGIGALNKSQAGSNLVAVGDSALFSQNGGTGLNTAVGSKSLFANTTGNKNTATGDRALFSNISGFENTAVGVNALKANTTGGGNIAAGTSALLNETTGFSNTGIGRSSLLTLTTGSSNTGVGAFTNVSTGSITNATAIGNSAVTDASNKIRLGNTSVTSIGGQVGFTTFSDARFKKNIKAETHGLDFIKLLKPVSYNYDIDGIENFWGVKDNKEAAKSTEAENSKAAQVKNRYIGFMAQDVAKAAESINYNFSGIDKPADDSKSTWGLRYGDFVVPLVKAVQELSVANDAKDAEIKTLQQKMETVLKQLSELKSMQQQPSGQTVVPGNTGDEAFAEQNAPNPFSTTTSIRYHLPLSAISSYIVITDSKGGAVKTITLKTRGDGMLTIAAGTLQQGTYFYSLVVDGKRIDTKQMIIIK